MAIVFFDLGIKRGRLVYHVVANEHVLGLPFDEHGVLQIVQKVIPLDLHDAVVFLCNIQRPAQLEKMIIINQQMIIFGEKARNVRVRLPLDFALINLQKIPRLHANHKLFDFVREPLLHVNILQVLFGNLARVHFEQTRAKLHLRLFYFYKTLEISV